MIITTFDLMKFDLLTLSRFTNGYVFNDELIKKKKYKSFSPITSFLRSTEALKPIGFFLVAL